MRNSVNNEKLSYPAQRPSNANSKVALVTGGSRGLGKEVALKLGNIGYNVAVNYVKEPSHVGEVSNHTSNNSLTIKAEVSDMTQVMSMAEEIKKKWGNLDLLVNNAGIIRDSLLIKATEEDWEEVLNINLKGCFNTVKAFAPILKNRGGGHIVNISSRSGLTGNSGQSAYSASKAALVGFTRSLASELGQFNIRVNAVIPGYMQTDMGMKSTSAIKRAKEKSFLGKLSDPAEVASFIAWLAGTEGITGQVFSLDSRM